MDRVLLCNGSTRLVPLVDERDGDEGYEGSFLHFLIADRLVREHGALPPEGGLPPPNVPAGYKLPAFSSWIVDWAVRHVLAEVPANWCLMVEVEMEWEFDGWISRGHADWLAFDPIGTKAKGGDWKTGRDPVEPAESNEQVNSYMVLAKTNWPSIADIQFQVCQPRVDEDDGFERVSTVVLEGERLEKAASVLDKRITAAIANDMEINSGRIQCRWCPCAIQCPALKLDQQRMKMTLTPEMLGKIKRTPDDATLADWVITARTLTQPTEDAVELLHARLDKAAEVIAGDGTRITRKLQPGGYKVPDPVTFLAAVRVLLPEDKQIAQVMKPSMTRLKDEIAKSMKIKKTGKDPVTAESVFDAHLRPLVEQDQKRILVFQ